MDAINSINNVFYYIHNARMVRGNDGHYYPEAVLQADFPCGIEHATDKWNGCVRRNDGDTVKAFISFYADLDNTHRKIMTQWVMDNYDCGFHI